LAHEATHSEAAHADHHKAHLKRYFAVWAVLIVCTVLTVWTGYMDLGKLNLPLALTIATLKASLVVLFFMHMTEAAGANRLVFSVSLLFLLVMLFGVFGDLWTRAPMTLPSAAPSTLGPEL
jgi:cytochrome c oxidase subunit 4